jgi:hypothetical protein
MRAPEKQLQVIGFFDAGELTQDIEGFYILGLLDQGSEPTTHAMNDIAAYCAEFEQSGIPIFFLFDSEASYQSFKLKDFKPLPKNTCFGFFDEVLLQKVINNLNLETDQLPIIVIANAKQGQAVFLSQGYTIGLGEQLLKTLGNI